MEALVEVRRILLRRPGHHLVLGMQAGLPLHHDVLSVRLVAVASLALDDLPVDRVDGLRQVVKRLPLEQLQWVGHIVRIVFQLNTLMLAEELCHALRRINHRLAQGRFSGPHNRVSLLRDLSLHWPD